VSDTSPTRTWLPWAAMVLVLGACFLVGALGSSGSLTAQDRVTSIAKTIKCPTCSGESVAESQAETSKTIRRDIAERVQNGQTDSEIRAYYQQTYGEEILLTPPNSGVAGLVWVIPVVALVVAAAGLVVVFRRWRVRPATRVTDADRALVAEALAAEHADQPRP